MKKKFSILIALVMAISLLLTPAVASAADPGVPTIDGVISPAGEWDGATVIPVASGMGTVSVIAHTDYLYVLFELADSTDVRKGEGYGDDKIGLNINPTDGDTYGFPYDIIFQTGINPDAWQDVSSGQTDGYETQWCIENVLLDLPSDVETVTLYSDGTRISEWKVPLGTIEGLSAGDTLDVGGACDIEKTSYKYPAGLEWGDASTYVDIPIPPPTKADILKDSGVPGNGLDKAPGLQKPFNPNSQAGSNAGKK